MTATAIDRNEAIQQIRKSLRQRSGKAWSVRGGEGSAWGWITITAPPSRQLEFGYMSDADRAELASLLGFAEMVHCQGVEVAASAAHRMEFVDRAAGRVPSVNGVAYWD